MSSINRFPKLGLHIGAGKCGSSTLQSSLSYKPNLKSDDGRDFEYVCIDGKGLIVEGATLRKHAKANPFGYVSSINAGNMATDRKIKAALEKLHKDDTQKIKVLSCEGWINHSQLFDNLILKDLPSNSVEVVLYIRPPLDWLNSAWWQWGAWSGVEFEKWVRNSIRHVLWARLEKAWSEIRAINKVRVRLATNDVLKDFGKITKTKLMSSPNLNSGANSLYLRVLQNIPELRPNPHASEIDFHFYKWDKNSTSKTPWLISSSLADEIFTRTKQDTNLLLKQVNPWIATQIRKDTRRHSYGEYSDRPLEQAERQELDINDYKAFIKQSMNALILASNK